MVLAKTGVLTRRRGRSAGRSRRFVRVPRHVLARDGIEMPRGCYSRQAGLLWRRATGRRPLMPAPFPSPCEPGWMSRPACSSPPPAGCRRPLPRVVLLCHGMSGTSPLRTRDLGTHRRRHGVTASTIAGTAQAPACAGLFTDFDRIADDFTSRGFPPTSTRLRWGWSALVGGLIALRYT